MASAKAIKSAQNVSGNAGQSNHDSVHAGSSRGAVRYHRFVQSQELMRYRKKKSLQAAGSLLCAAIASRFVLDLEGTEFSGGRITGPLLQLQNVGTLLFLLAATLTFPFRRTASVIALLACLLCLPLYLLFTAPGPFRWVVGGEWKVPLFGKFAWDWWSIGGIAALAFTTFVCVRSLLSNPNARA